MTECCENPILVCIDGVTECYNCGWFNKEEFYNRYSGLVKPNEEKENV